MTYAALFVLVAISWVGVPAAGSAAIGAAGVLASQGEMDIVLVVVVSSIAAAIGGVGGYFVGERAGAADRVRGPAGGRRARALDRGHELYARWGRIAVFFTPCYICGALRMPFRMFVIWNSLAATLWSAAAGLGAYGLGTLSASDHRGRGVLPLLIALGILVAIGALAWSHTRRRRLAKLS
jgi:membrane protein DedA with SNARE-associated domain